jgi:hypothetical protein
MAYEVKECKKGEVNAITREYFCNQHNEFCKFINYCNEKQERLRDK